MTKASQHKIPKQRRLRYTTTDKIREGRKERQRQSEAHLTYCHKASCILSTFSPIYTFNPMYIKDNKGHFSRRICFVEF
jgi:hypothetical protein